MEAWRRELYQTLSHSVEGSTWKDHKYIAIVDGKYIYPEDVQNGSSSSAASSQSSVNTASTTKSSSESGKVTPPTTPKKVKKQMASDGKQIDVTDKGSVKSYKELPPSPTVGDMYLLEDTKKYVYWDGEKWTPIEEGKETVSAPTAAPTSGGGGGGAGGKKESSELSKETTDKVRDVVKKTYSAPKKKAPIPLNAPASSVAGSKQVKAGKKAVANGLKSLVSKAVSSIKNTKLYKAGSKLIVKLKGGTSSKPATNPVVSKYRGVQR